MPERPPTRRRVDSLFTSGQGEAYDVTLEPVNRQDVNLVEYFDGKAPLVVRVNATDEVAAAINASNLMGYHWGIVTHATDVEKVDWEALVDAYLAESSDA